MNLIDPSIPAKKHKLLEASLSLMLSKGYHGTTVDEICSEAGVTKGSFFHYFKSKEDAGMAAIHYFERLQSYLMGEAGFDLRADPWEKLQAYLDFFAALSQSPDSPQSCLTAIMTQEMSDLNDDFRALCDDKFLNNAKPLKVILDEVIQACPPSVPIDSQSLSDYFLSIYQGALILARAKKDRSLIERNVEHFRQYLSFLFIK